MLKMHLELDDLPSSVGEIEERNIEHNSNSNNDLSQSIQLEEEIKALKDASASEAHHTNTTTTEEKPEVIDLRDNCVYIENFQCSDRSVEKAFFNVRKLADQMNVEIPKDSIIYIVVDAIYIKKLNYYVYFCDPSIKKEFLKNKHFYKYHPETSPLRIFDYSEWGIVNIENVRSSDLSLETAYANVIGIAKEMGIMADWQVKDPIDHIDVFRTISNILTYSVRFKNDLQRKKFLQYKDILEQFPETKSLKILDAGGHKLTFPNVNGVSLTAASSANLSGVAELMGLSLTRDNVKRIYLLNHVPYFRERYFSLIVEFSSKQVKDEFLEKKYKLNGMEYDFVETSGINAEEMVSVKCNNRNSFTTLSFIGLAEQLGCSFTSDQIKHFFDLSNLIDDAYTR